MLIFIVLPATNNPYRMPDIQRLLTWYHQNRRDLPWRQTSDPYKIWLSEVILQQTRVAQGLQYYHAFVSQYPTVQALAAANIDDVLKLWQGLGYYTRARNLHAAAQIIVQNHGGIFPDNYRDLLQLPGIGPYTAAAIASIAFGERQPAIDGNVLRVVSRWFAVHEPIDSPAGIKIVRELVQQLMPAGDSGTFNEAMMEFGACYCIPVNPDCGQCVFARHCAAHQQKIVKMLPVKKPKVKIRHRTFYYVVVLHKNHNEPSVLLTKRAAGDIWQGLYTFPVIETQTEIPPEQLFSLPEWRSILPANNFVVTHTSSLYTHQLTHQRLHARFVVIQANGDFRAERDTKFSSVRLDQLHQFAVPRLIDRFLTDYFKVS
ncbi:MAG: A/G-specific adenine glycosylase [Bacteroidales bacterium]|nr:A/G-specific adenine glycosylase [Bacteroidales bacterium]